MVMKHVIRAAMVVTIGGTLAAGVALATAPSGVLSGTVVARGTFVVPVDLKFKVDDGSTEVVHVTDARQTVMQEIVLAPNGSTGWHSHPGPVVVVIKSGTMTFYDSTCVVRTYTAGQAFIDSGQGARAHREESRSDAESHAVGDLFRRPDRRRVPDQRSGSGHLLVLSARDRSKPAKRRARERVGESEERSPSDY